MATCSRAEFIITNIAGKPRCGSPTSQPTAPSNSMAHVALAWVTGRPAVTSTILGARTLAQLEDNLASADLHLDEKEVALLDQASDPGARDYPYGEMGVAQRERKLAGGR